MSICFSRNLSSKEKGHEWQLQSQSPEAIISTEELKKVQWTAKGCGHRHANPENWGGANQEAASERQSQEKTNRTRSSVACAHWLVPRTICQRGTSASFFHPGRLKSLCRRTHWASSRGLSTSLHAWIKRFPASCEIFPIFIIQDIGDKPLTCTYLNICVITMNEALEISQWNWMSSLQKEEEEGDKMARNTHKGVVWVGKDHPFFLKSPERIYECLPLGCFYLPHWPWIFLNCSAGKKSSYGNKGLCFKVGAEDLGKTSH